MEGPGDYSPLDRPRILTSSGRSTDNLTAPGFTEVSSGGGGGHTPSVNDIAGRASTPTTLTTLGAQYHSRYLHSAMPGSNFALMNSFLTTGSPSSESRKTLLPELQHYWGVPAETFPRYLMARGLYSPYPPLFSAAPESLSLIGPGVACVPGNGNSAGPSSSLSGSHYQRLIEMQNEAFLATVTASASHHHPALYGLGPNNIPPPFLDQPTSSSASSSGHASTPLSLVKQEPKDMSCAEKAAKASDRRSSSFKLDLEHVASGRSSKDGGHFLPLPRQDIAVGRDGAVHNREQKSVVTSLMSTMTSGKANDKRSSGYGAQFSTASGNSGGGGDSNNEGHNMKKTASTSSSLGESGARRFQASGSRNNASPAPSKEFVSKISNPHVLVVPGKKPSPKLPSNPKHPKASTPASSSPLLSKELSTSSSSPDHSVIISIPTSISAPIPLATVQHDGVVLAALASPSSAAASSAGTSTVKSVPPSKSSERPSAHILVGRTGVQADSPRVCPEVSHPSHPALRSQPDATADIPEESQYPVERRTVVSGLTGGWLSHSPDVVVDSTDDTKMAASLIMANSKYDKDRAIVETIERVAAATSDNDGDDDDDDEDDDVTEHVSVVGDINMSRHVASSSQSAMSSQSLTVTRPLSFSSGRQEPSTPNTRSVSAKTQPVSLAASTAGSACISSNSLTATTTTQAAMSALRYYNTLSTKERATKKVHAHTYVPEVGVFKGPSTNTYVPEVGVFKGSSTKTPMRHQPSSCSHLSPPLSTSDRAPPLEQLPLNVHVGDSLVPAKPNDSAPSPGLLSPPLLSPGSVTSCTLRFSSSTSPRALAVTPDVVSSLDSVSVYSASLASVQSVMEDNVDASDDSDAELVIDGVDEDEEEEEEVEPVVHHKDSNMLSALDKNAVMFCANDRVDPVTVNLGESTEYSLVDHKVTRCSSQSLGTNKGCTRLKGEVIDYSLHRGPYKALPPTEVGTTLHLSRQPNLHLDRSSLIRQPNLHGNSFQRCVQDTVSSRDRGAKKSVVSVSKTLSPSSSTPSSIISASLPEASFPGDSDHQDVYLPVPRIPRSHAIKPSQEGTSKASSYISRCRWSRLLPPASRCGSAPPPDTGPCQGEKTPPPEPMQPANRIDGMPESSCGFNIGNIPVGIAVAQIRPHHLHHDQSNTNSPAPATELRLPQGEQGAGRVCLSTAVNTTQSAIPGQTASPSLSSSRPGKESDVTSIVPETPAPISGRLPPAGHVVNPSLWLQQLSFPLQAGPPYSSMRYPISAPSGFKFAHDPVTGQFFLIATGEASGASHQPSLSPPSASVEEHRRRDRQSSKPAMSQGEGQGTPSQQALTDKALNARIISTLRKDGTKQQAIAQPFTTSNVDNSNSNNGNSNSNISSSNDNSSTQVTLPPTSSSSSLTPHQHLLNAVSLAYHPVKTERRTTQSRGCSPIIFDSKGKFLPSQSLSATFKRPRTRSVAIQTCNDLANPGAAKAEPLGGGKYSSSLRSQSNQSSPKTETPRSHPALNPLSVHCPDMDPLPNRVKAGSDRLGYNPFTDPQILQAADGLELLSTLAEKRPKSYDDPKRIFPSPSDSFKSDTASVLAPEDTLSPAEGEMKSGQCTPRRDMRRDLSPKWTLPKKEPSTSTTFGDFKAPTGLELVDPVEVRERLAEVQRRYKEKQKELAKLDGKKPDSSDTKASKRGPGRPPKKKTPTVRKSDDDSSSSSSRTKDGHSHKKKRPAEELVDRVFRKLPPVKPSKASRSIHYVKSKTGPFFKRKPAPSSSKRSRDLFGFDDKSWLNLHEGKHKKKYRDDQRSKGKKKDVVTSIPPESLLWKKEKPANVPDTKGAVTSKVDNSKSHEGKERRGRPTKTHGTRNGKESVKSVAIVTVKSEPNIIQCDSGLGRLGKISFTSTQPSSSNSSLITTSLTSTNTISVSTAISSSSTCSMSTVTATVSTTTMTTCSNTSSSVCSLFTSSKSSVTFGTMSSIMQGSELNLGTSSSSVITPTTSSTTISVNINNNCSKALNTTPTTSLSTSSSSLPSLFSFDDSSFLHHDTSSTGKRKGEEDSDTDTSDTSPNKKRKPGRPRKINPDKSAGGTETIWAKKSNSMSLLQIPDAGPMNKDKDKDKDIKMKMELNPSVMKPLFLDDEWCRRRSERIFLSEPSPQPSPSPRAEPVWKLSNFMPKNTKISMENPKDDKDDEKELEVSIPANCEEKSVTLSVNNQSNRTLDEDEDDLTSQKPLSSTVQPSSSVKAVQLSSSVKAVQPSSSVKEVQLSSSVKAVQPSSSVKAVQLSSSVKAVQPSSSVKEVQLSSSVKAVQPSSSVKAVQPSSSVKGKKGGKGRGKAVEKDLPKPAPRDETSTPSPTPSMKKAKRAQEHTKMKHQKAKSLHDLTQKVKKKYSKGQNKKTADEKSQLQRSTNEKNRKRRSGSDSSDTDTAPLSPPLEDCPITPEPASAVITEENLKDGLRVLYLIEGLFYEGVVKAIQPPDVYGVLTAGQRGTRPHILCQEEILRDAVVDVKAQSIRYLPEGARICAFWSQQFSCLYPGTIAKTSPNPHEQTVVSVEFDDGDSGRIPVDHVRLLPSNFPIIEYEPDPLENLPKRRKRTSSSKPSVTDSKPHKKSKTVSKEDDEDDEEEKSDEEGEGDSGDSDDSDDSLIWRWAGKSTKRPGLKGRAKKEFYRSIMRGKETIMVGDSAVFVSTGRVNCPYIGRVESLWESWGGQKMVRVSWYYHPEETKGGKRLADTKNALFESPHGDENDVQTISRKCEVLSHSAYKRRLNDANRKGQSIGPNLFYLAGYYDPTVSLVKFEPGVL